MPTVRDALVGAWRLRSFVFVREDGHTINALGDRPQGLLVYTATGQMSANLQQRNRLVAHTDDFRALTAAETETAFTGYNGYCGAFEVDEEQKIVRHKVEIAWFQNFEGTEQVRHYELDGDVLTLSAAPRMLAGALHSTRLVWDRVR